MVVGLEGMATLYTILALLFMVSAFINAIEARESSDLPWATVVVVSAEVTMFAACLFWAMIEFGVL